MAETSPVLLLIGMVVLILVAVGIFVATLAYLQRAQSRKRAQEAAPRPLPPSLETPLAGPPAQAPLQAAMSPIETPASPGEVMRVVRDERTGRVLVEVDGQRYTHIREISDAQVGRRVLWAIADLVRFTGGMATNPQAVRSAAPQRNGASAPESTPPAREAAVGPTPISVTRSEPQPGAGRTGVTGAVETGGAPTLVPPVTQPGVRAEPAVAGRPTVRMEGTNGPLPGPTAPVSPAWEAGSADVDEPKRSGILEFFRRGFQAPAVTGTARRPGSFIDEIEAILQQHISGRGTPLPYSVHVKTGPNGRLQIEVGPNVYGSPDQIPDPEVKELIKTAVAEWERR